jgi:hypothetical protein
MDKRPQIKKYFKPFPKWVIGLIILGVAVSAATGLGRGLAPIDERVPVVGVILIIIGILKIGYWASRPKDRQMDVWIDEDLQGMENRALEKTGLDESELVRESVLLTGLRFWNIGGAEIHIRKGNDDTIRYTPVGVTVINFTQHQLVAYQCALDLITGNPLSESTDEYFYRDVVSVSTQTESMTWDKAMLSSVGLAETPLAGLMKDGKLQFNAANMFVLTTSGGTSIKVIMKDPELIESVGGGNLPTERADKAIQAIRKMLRDKKSA